MIYRLSIVYRQAINSPGQTKRPEQIEMEVCDATISTCNGCEGKCNIPFRGRQGQQLWISKKEIGRHALSTLRIFMDESKENLRFVSANENTNGDEVNFTFYLETQG